MAFVMVDEIVEYAGLTQQAASLIERHRRSPDETKSQIVVRILSGGAPLQMNVVKQLSLGQGATLHVGESVYLFLNEDSKDARRPDALAVVTEKGLSIAEEVFAISNGSYLNAPMKSVQEKLDHRNAKGELISLNAWTRWHARRDNNLVPLVDLKDPKLARKRGRLPDIDLDLSDL